MSKNLDAKKILDSLSIKEKIRLLNGVGSWYNFDASGKLPKIMMTDGPHGLRKQKPGQIDINDSVTSTCFPTASCVANSWDLDLIEQMADAIANQALQEEVSIVLGPGTNIKRSPMCGRNFEYFSEDPLLAGSLTTAYVHAMQAKNVGTSVKHFACNNQETRRQSSDSILDERALREIYLRPFEIAVRNAQPTTLMASYNKINGEYTCKNKYILDDILHNEWGFNGAIMSDWGAAVDAPNCIKNGMDLAMPDSGGYQPSQIQKALDNNTISEQDIDRAALKIISLVLRFNKNKKTKVDYNKAHLIAKKIASESAVLLKNNGVLPLNVDTKNKKLTKEIYVLGSMAEKMRIQGGGSSHINPYKITNILEALKGQGFTVHYAQSYPDDDTVETTTQEQIDQLTNHAIAFAKEAESKKIPLIACFGLTNRTEGEGFDRRDINLPKEQIYILNKIIQYNKNIIAVTFGGSPFAVPFEKDLAAILHLYLAGESCAEACVDLLTGKINPSGKLAETYPLSANDIPSNATWGKNIPSIEYRESIFTGYRFYETFKIPVLYEFGYGLSYTTFEYSNLKVSIPKGSTSFDATNANDAIGNVGATCGYKEKLSKSKNKIKVEFTVKNTGKVAGAEVVQLYVKNPSCNYLRATKELRSFKKVFIEPKKSKKVVLELDEKAFSLFDTKLKKWLCPTGSYEIQICSSVKNVKLKKSIKIKGQKFSQDDKQKLPSYFCKNQKSEKIDVAKLFTHSDFVKLFGSPLPKDLSPTQGSYTIFDNFTEAASLSPICKKILDKIIFNIIKDNKKKGLSENDPAVKIGIGGITENPLESMILLSCNQFTKNHADAIVNLANGKKWTALLCYLKTFWKGKKYE